MEFVAVEGLRPTPDRVRETLFNWLQWDITGLRCLDFFAGSGALAFEAVSRGAASALMVEQDRRVVQRLQQHSRELAADRLSVRQFDALKFLSGPPEPFDLVFLDPPFGNDLLGPLCQVLEQGGWLTPQAFIYCESEARLGEPAIPPNWQWLKAKQSGDVGYRLARRGELFDSVAS